MSKYTTMLRWIVEEKAKEYPQPEGQRYADGVYDYLGLGSYPIFDAAYRSALNDKIIDHFYFREIGFETAAQFAWYMRRTMNEIMPKYNALYTAQATMDLEHPLSDYVRHRIETWEGHVDDDTADNLRRDFTGSQAKTYNNAHNLTENDTLQATDNDTHNVTVSESTENSSVDTGTSSSVDTNRNVFQDTPMSLLSNEGSPSVEGLDYATNVTYDNGSGSTNTRNTSDSEGERSSRTTETDARTKSETRNKQLSETDASTTNDSRIEATTDARTVTRDKDDAGERTYDEYGNNRSWALLMEEFADKWMNIDMMVIDDLETLFMGLW